MKARGIGFSYSWHQYENQPTSRVKHNPDPPVTHCELLREEWRIRMDLNVVRTKTKTCPLPPSSSLVMMNWTESQRVITKCLTLPRLHPWLVLMECLTKLENVIFTAKITVLLTVTITGAVFVISCLKRNWNCWVKSLLYFVPAWLACL